MNRTQLRQVVLRTGHLPCHSAFATHSFPMIFQCGGSSASYAVITADATNSFAQFGYDYSVLGIPSPIVVMARRRVCD